MSFDSQTTCSVVVLSRYVRLIRVVVHGAACVGVVLRCLPLDFEFSRSQTLILIFSNSRFEIFETLVLCVAPRFFIIVFRARSQFVENIERLHGARAGTAADGGH